MKKLFDGKLYNSETATLIGMWNNQCFSVSEYECVSLYQRSKGEYFLYCVGGANSRFANAKGSDWVAGERIVPITEQQAEVWRQAHLLQAEDGLERE